MTVRVERYTAERFGEWNRFVESSGNGTLFHQLDFLSYHPADRFDFDHLLFLKDNKLLALLPGGRVEESYRSPVGASFGSVVHSGQISLVDANEIVQSLIAYCREDNLKEIRLTPPMPVYGSPMNEVMEYALIYNGFSETGSLYSSVIDCSHTSGRENLDVKIRYNINKAAREGVAVSESDDLETFYPILLENKAKFGTPPTHTLEELKRIDELCPNRTKLFLATLADETVAGTLLFLSNKNCATNFYCMHRYEHHRLNALSLLVEESLRWCVENGYRYYDYGVSQDTVSDNPLEPSWTLVKFKESFNSFGCFRRTFSRKLTY